jgi:hypothetical protein
MAGVSIIKQDKEVSPSGLTPEEEQYLRDCVKALNALMIIYFGKSLTEVLIDVKIQLGNNKPFYGHVSTWRPMPNRKATKRKVAKKK